MTTKSVTARLLLGAALATAACGPPEREASDHAPDTDHAADSAASPEDSAVQGFEFRGLGQEPGWLVEIDPDRSIQWMGDYGEVRFVRAFTHSVRVVVDGSEYDGCGERLAGGE